MLVIDNGGRDDEACIGDLTVAEARIAGLAGIVVWGYHRDAAALEAIGLPVWSLGAFPAGPRSARSPAEDPFASANLGSVLATRDDIVVADDDGVVVVEMAGWPEVETTAAGIVAVEGRQAAAIAAGTSLRDQLGCSAYLARRRAEPGYALRRHLEERGAAVET